MGYKVYSTSKFKLPQGLEVVLDELGLKFKSFKIVLIKPNICGFYPPDLKLLKALLNYFTELSGLVIIGETESTMYKPEERFQTLGITDLINAYSERVKLMNLIKGDKVRVKVPDPRSVRSLRLPKLVFEVDYFINLAKIGSHPSTVVTGALKNLFGLVAEKYKYFKYHPRGMDRVIADIAKVVKPDLNIVEANDKILLSEDTLAIDVIATKIFGVDPFSVKHFKMIAEDRGSSLEGIISEIEVINV